MRFIALLFTCASLPALAQTASAPLDLTLTSFTFTGHAFLHDFKGQAQDFQGGAEIDPANPNFVTAAVIDIVTARMTTFEETRDRNMHKWLQSHANPRIEYRLDKIERLAGDPATATRKHPARFSVTGDFTLNRTTRPLTTTVIGWRNDGLLVVTGHTTIDTVDYGLPIVRQLFLTVDKNVDVSFRLVFDLPPETAVKQ